MKESAMKKLFFLILIICSFTPRAYGENEVKLFRGELEGAKILIAEPAPWNKKLLILAHEYREPDTALTADFDTNSRFYKTLLNEGWMIGSTSYRKNGIAYKEGLEDVGLLRKYIIKTYGAPDKIFIRGASMGGAIAITLCEKHSAEYAGALIIDPAIREELGFSLKPMIPILFLSNQKEADAVKGYAADLKMDAVKPAHWVVKRDGHLNVNAEEELAAFKALVEYAGGKDIAMEQSLLIIPKDKPSLAVFADGGAYTKITRVHPKYGNLDTEFTPGDAAGIGLEKGKPFTVIFAEKKYKVLLGTSFGDVSKGEWIAFFQQDGLLKIARNFESAAALLGCKDGDILLITK
ncbi:MAG: hypothetical protein FP816_20785 [Desulfobacteraceae bacterium]|nr:hypothetical protein [Desulfobacteraceae bacterium]